MFMEIIHNNSMVNNDQQNKKFQDSLPSPGNLQKSLAKADNLYKSSVLIKEHKSLSCFNKVGHLRVCKQSKSGWLPQIFINTLLRHNYMRVKFVYL